MKKYLSIVALLLVAVMAVMCLAACGDKKDLAGTYKLTNVTDTKGNESAMNAYKDYVTLTVDKDNVGSMTISYEGSDNTVKITFDPKEMTATTQDGSKGSYEFDGKKLTLKTEKDIETFEKQ